MCSFSLVLRCKHRKWRLAIFPSNPTLRISLLMIEEIKSRENQSDPFGEFHPKTHAHSSPGTQTSKINFLEGNVKNVYNKKGHRLIAQERLFQLGQVRQSFFEVFIAVWVSKIEKKGQFQFNKSPRTTTRLFNYYYYPWSVYFKFFLKPSGLVNFMKIAEALFFSWQRIVVLWTRLLDSNSIKRSYLTWWLSRCS